MQKESQTNQKGMQKGKLLYNTKCPFRWAILNVDSFPNRGINCRLWKRGTSNGTVRKASAKHWESISFVSECRIFGCWASLTSRWEWNERAANELPNPIILFYIVECIEKMLWCECLPFAICVIRHHLSRSSKYGVHMILFYDIYFTTFFPLGYLPVSKLKSVGSIFNYMAFCFSASYIHWSES